MRHVLASFRSLGLVGCIVATLTGCQPPGTDGSRSLSADEARRAAGGMESRAYDVPPRSLFDIDRLLEDHAPDAAAEHAALAGIADRAPPSGTTETQLARFYFERADAAAAVGRAGRVRQDLEQAGALLRQAGTSEAGGLTQHDVVVALAAAHLMVGDAAAAREAAMHALDLSTTPATRLVSASLASSYALRLGRLGEARALQAAALELEPQVRGPDVPADSVPVYLARLRLTDSLLAIAAGDAATAERLAQEARRQAEIAKARSERATAVDRRTAATLLSAASRATLSEQLTREGRHAEAEARAGLGEIVRRFGPGSPTAQGFLVQLAVAVLEQDRAGDSARLARRAIATAERTGVATETEWLNHARRTLGTAMLMEGSPREAVAAFDSIAVEPAGSSDHLTAALHADIGRALALVQSGDAARARQNLDNALARQQRSLGPDGPGLALLRGALAVARRATGDRNGALALWRSQDTIGRIAAATPRGAVAATYRRLVLEDYLALVSELPSNATPDPVAETFRIAETLRGSAAQRALARPSARQAAAMSDPQLADLAQREQQAESLAKAASDLLVAMLAGGAATAADIAALRERVVTLEAGRRALRAELSGRFPAYASLIEPQPSTPAMVQASLGDDEALVAIYQLSDRLLIWGIPRRGQTLFAVARRDAASIEREVAAVRRALVPGATPLGDIPSFDIAAAHRLFGSVLEPVATAWRPARHLITVPHGPLAAVPWQLLPTRPIALPEWQPLFAGYRAIPWLARTHAVSALPSAGSLPLLRATPPGAPDRRPLVGFGNPAFGTATAATGTGRGGAVLALRSSSGTRTLASARVGDLTPLPETAEELIGIATIIGANPRTDLHLGAAASEGTVKSLSSSGQLSHYRVVMFATHALLPGDLDGLTQPALALTGPAIARDGEDGLLTLDEILGLRLDADWAILSACNAAPTSPGTEAFAGLGRAFFHAGARALLVSSWPVHSQAARDLMARVFDPRTERTAAESRAEALRRSMLGMIDRGEFKDEAGRTVFAYAHPLFWAPFSLLGDGGTR